MYIDAPVNNIVRSTGKEGTIRVSARAEGLAAGTVEIQVAAAAAGGAGAAGAGGAIVEPALKESGRERVARDPAPPAKKRVKSKDMRDADEELKR